MLNKWEEELKYIRNINIDSPGINFNNDKECFKRYAKMQANLASKEGFDEISKVILTYIEENEK